MAAEYDLAPATMEGLPPAPVDYGVTEYLQAPPSPAVSPIAEVPAPGVGQAYDIPVSDVIAEEAAEVFSTNNWFRGGRWYSRQDFVMLLRTDLPSTHIAVDLARNTLNGNFDIFQTGTLNSKNADFNFEGGTRLTLGRMLGRDSVNRDHGIEFTFMGLFDFEGRASIGAVSPAAAFRIETLLGTNETQSNGTNNGTLLGFAVPNNVAGFTNAESQAISYQADFDSFEINYTIGGRPIRDRLVMQPDGRWVRHATPSKVRALYAGLRYVRQNETFYYDSVGGDTGAEFGSYRVNTDNDLIGLQLGGEIVDKRTDWVFGLIGKVGGLVNFADRHSRVEGFGDLDFGGPDEATNFFRSEALDDVNLAFLGEAGVYLSYYIRPNTSLRLGYSLIYINGMATATNNLGLNPQFPRFEITGDSMYHGLNLGFEMTW